MPAFRCPAIVSPMTTITRAPAHSASAAVSSIEPPSTTMISSIHKSESTACAICALSLSVGITTVIATFAEVAEADDAMLNGAVSDIRNGEGGVERALSSCQLLARFELRQAPLFHILNF